MKVGDLVKWVDYTVVENGKYVENGKAHIGYVLKEPRGARVKVLYNGEEQQWIAWQCEVVSESC